MFSKERMTKTFQDHIATFHDFGVIKVLDFKRPDSNEGRIRFIFEEDHCKLHISGDYGSLTASNATNMTFEKFGQFVRDPGYFESKIECAERALEMYDYDEAYKKVLSLVLHVDDSDFIQAVIDDEAQDVDEEIKETASEIDYMLSNHFTEQAGLDLQARDLLNEEYGVSRDDLYDAGRMSTGIIDLYLLAFELAAKQLDN